MNNNTDTNGSNEISAGTHPHHVYDDIPDALKIDPKIILISLKRGIPFIVLCIILIAVTLPTVIKENWKATCELIQRDKEINLQLTAPYTYKELTIDAALQTIKLPDTIHKVKELLELSIDAEDLVKNIEVRKKQLQIITISVIHKNKEKSKKIANTLGQILIDSQAKQLNEYHNKILNY